MKCFLSHLSSCLILGWTILMEIVSILFSDTFKILGKTKVANINGNEKNIPFLKLKKK